MNYVPLKYLLFLENATCIFRNFMCLKKCSRVLVICWVFIEVSSITVNVAATLANENGLQIKAQRIYYFSVTSFSIYIIFSSLYYSKRFYKLLINFDAFFNIFDDRMYFQNLSKAQKVLTILVVLFCGIKIAVSTLVRAYHGDHGLGLVTNTFTQYHITVCDFRYIFQYFILHCILFIISEQLRAVTRSIEGAIPAARVRWGRTYNVGDLISVTATQNRLDKLDKWVKAYENINYSSNLLNSMFSIQLTIMLLIVTTYYIILLYSIAILTVEGTQSVSSLLVNTFSMVVFLWALFVISRAGQRVQCSSLQLRRKLCELCVHTIEDEQYYKLAKDLLRCVRTRPVRVHVFGTLDVNMSLLPSVVAFFTSNTVIALQFNNVL